jgi:hypothetical protein
MLRLIGLVIIIIIILVGVDYVITSSTSSSAIITVTGKYITGNSYFIETMSLDKFETTNDIYYKLDGGNTYKVRVLNNKIIGIVNRIN